MFGLKSLKRGLSRDNFEGKAEIFSRIPFGFYGFGDQVQLFFVLIWNFFVLV